jgi:hypothetical protein
LLLVDYLGLTVIRTSSVAMNTRKNSARRNRVSKVSDLGSHGCRRFGLDLLVASERLGATLDFDRGLASHLTYDRIQIVYIMKACERAGNPSRPLASISRRRRNMRWLTDCLSKRTSILGGARLLRAKMNFGRRPAGQVMKYRVAGPKAHLPCRPMQAVVSSRAFRRACDAAILRWAGSLAYLGIRLVAQGGA